MSDIMVGLLSSAMRIPTRGSIGDCTFYNCDFTGPYLHVNRESNMPSELSEAGFHTSSVQNQRNMNAEWKKLEARSFLWTFLKFHNVPRPPVRIITGIISDIEGGIPINGATALIDNKTYTTDTYQSLFYLYSNDSTQLHNGFYYIENLSSDTLELIVTAPNYLPDTLSVVVSDTFFTYKDVQLISSLPPKVVSSNPVQNDSIYPGRQDIIFNFSRRMNKASVESSLVFTPSAYLNFSWVNSDKTLIIYSDSLEFSTNYSIEILPTATDIYGNLFDGNGDGIGGDTLIFNFKTRQLDIDPPVVTGFYPAGNVNIELHPLIRINFNEEISFVNIYSLIKLVKASDQTQITGTIRHYVLNDKSVLHFFPSIKLSPSENYQFKILAGIKDLLDNQIANDSIINLQTGNTDLELTGIDNFEANLTTNWWQPSASGSTTGIIPGETGILENSLISNLLTSSAKSMQLNYSWDIGSSSWLLREYLSAGTPRDVLFDNSYLLQVYIFGDGSNNQFRFAVDDNVPQGGAADHEVSPWYTIDWTGWKLITWDMTNDGTGTWIGDGNLDGSLRFDSFQMSYNQINGAQKGTVYFDDLRLAKKVLVDINDEFVSALPSNYSLFQNYPNPFNPSTIIQYQIPEDNFITIKVYDILGKEVAIVVSEQKSMGAYRIEFDASDFGLTSGVYFYTLKAGDFSETKKLILMK